MNNSKSISQIHYREFMKEVISSKHEESIAVPEIARRHCILEQKALKYFKALTHPLATVKEYHTLTQDQYIVVTYEPKTPFGRYSYEDVCLAKEDHKRFIEESLSNGIKVSNDVLKDYPDLMDDQPTQSSSV